MYGVGNTKFISLVELDCQRPISMIHDDTYPVSLETEHNTSGNPVDSNLDQYRPRSASIPLTAVVHTSPNTLFAGTQISFSMIYSVQYTRRKAQPSRQARRIPASTHIRPPSTGSSQRRFGLRHCPVMLHSNPCKTTGCWGSMCRVLAL